MKNFRSLKEIDDWEEPFIDKIIDSEDLEHGGTRFWYLNKISVVLVKLIEIGLIQIFVK